MKNQKNFRSKMGEAFYSDAVTIVFGKGRFVMDFKKTAPRIDRIGGDQRQSLMTEHNPVILQPQAAKMMMKILENNIEKYEEKFGEIKLPKRKKKEDIETSEANTESHNYIG